MLKPDDAETVRAARILTPASGYLVGFTHTLNPYVGCAFGDGGCGVYCYVAESPVALFTGKPWGTWLRAKTNAAGALARELRASGTASALRVFMSSATDPYQPAEATLRITRSILETLRERPIGLLVVQTRSPLVERDYDVLADMPFAWLSMTVETDDDGVRRALTPVCPSIDRRLASMRRARERGIKVQAAVSPALPGDPLRFATMLDAAADRVVVDTFAGDGAGGKRTMRRPLPARYAELGWGDWRDDGAARRLFDALRARLGEQRVFWSQQGFNALAVEAGGRSAPARAFS